MFKLINFNKQNNRLINTFICFEFQFFVNYLNKSIDSTGMVDFFFCTYFGVFNNNKQKNVFTVFGDRAEFRNLDLD